MIITVRPAESSASASRLERHRSTSGAPVANATPTLRPRTGRFSPRRPRPFDSRGNFARLGHPGTAAGASDKRRRAAAEKWPTFRGRTPVR
jgi:hypothetical protein